MVEDQNLLLNVLSGLTLVNLLLKLGHLVLAEEQLELESHDPASLKQAELLNDLIFALNDFIVKLGNHLVLHQHYSYMQFRPYIPLLDILNQLHL